MTDRRTDPEAKANHGNPTQAYGGHVDKTLAANSVQAPLRRSAAPWQIMTTQRKARVAELVAQGLTATEMVPILEAEGMKTAKGAPITRTLIANDILWLQAQWMLHAQESIISHKASLLQKIAWMQKWAAAAQDIKAFGQALKLEIDVTGAASPTIIGIGVVSAEEVQRIRDGRWTSAAAALAAAGIEPTDNVIDQEPDVAETE